MVAMKRILPMPNRTTSRFWNFLVAALVMAIIVHAGRLMRRGDGRAEASTSTVVEYGKGGTATFYNNIPDPTFMTGSNSIGPDNDDPFLLGPAVVSTEGQHVSSPPPTGSCSCWNETADCCERGIHPAHKFGHMLVMTLFGEKFNPNWNGEKYTHGHHEPYEYIHRKIDYREVFVVRNWFDALASGYLYHKAGHECLLSRDGTRDKPLKADAKTHPDNVKPELLLTAPYPPLKNRDLCTYLKQESERDGLRVYIEWVIRRYYAGFVEVFKAVQQNEDPKHRRTKFICFEDLSNPATKMDVAYEIVNWLYPGGQPGHLPPPPAKDMTDVHGTSHDPTLRTRLVSIAKDLDTEVFHGAIRSSSDLFGCGTD